MFDHIAFYYKFLSYSLLALDDDELAQTEAMEAYTKALQYEDLMEYSYHTLHSENAHDHR